MKALALFFLFTTLAVAQPIVVLPQRFQDRHVVIRDSVEYRTIMSETKALKQQVQAEQKRLDAFATQVDKDRREQADAIQKLQAEAAKPKGKSSIWGFILGILNIGVWFISNPLGFLMKFLFDAVLGLVIIFVVFLLLRFLYHRLKIEKKK